MKTKPGKYHLTIRETEIIYLMWDAGKPLMASEMVGNGLSISTVHTAIRKLTEKKLLEVVDFVRNGTTFARIFQPTFTRNEYELDMLTANFTPKNRQTLTTSELLDTFLQGLDKQASLKELDELEQLIVRKRNELNS